MASRFHGWPEQAQEVLLQLEGEPSPQTRERVRRDRESQVRQPMISLLSDLADVDPWYEDFAVWRYASMAYWWQNQCAIVRVARHVDIGFRFSLDGLQVKGAWWYAGPEQIASFRAAVAGDESGPALEDLVSSLSADGHEVSGDVMKRVPRGYPADHPRAGLLEAPLADRRLRPRSRRRARRRAGVPGMRTATSAARLAHRAHGRRAGGCGGRRGRAVTRAAEP